MFTCKIWKIQKNKQEKCTILHASINTMFIFLSSFSVFHLLYYPCGHSLCSLYSLVSRSGYFIPLGFWNLLHPSASFSISRSFFPHQGLLLWRPSTHLFLPVFLENLPLRYVSHQASSRYREVEIHSLYLFHQKSKSISKLHACILQFYSCNLQSKQKEGLGSGCSLNGGRGKQPNQRSWGIFWLILKVASLWCHLYIKRNRKLRQKHEHFK